jgi:tetratricopeptide (TPR) repeat protein
MRKRILIYLLCSSTMLLALLVVTAAWADDEENIGRLAEERGELSKAYNHYVTALQTAPEESDEEMRLLQRIIKVTAKFDSPPEVPSEARENLFRGQEQLNDTTYPGHWRAAIGEFRTALREAPWWADVYYKLASAQEGGGHYAKAATYLKLYLLAKPGLANASQLKDKIEALESRATSGR